MSIPDLGIDFDRIAGELKNDLGDVFGKVAAQARGGLERIAGTAQNTGTGLERIAGAGGGVNPLARIAAFGGGGGNGLANIAGYGQYGGTGLDFFDTLGGSDPFAAFNRASAISAMQPEVPEPQTPPGYPTSGGAGVGATGADPATDKWRDLIDQAAAEHGIDGDIIQAIMMIESGGNAGAVSAAGAQGLMQVMPFHFQPGEDGMDPRTNVSRGAKVLSDNFKRWGNWDKAVAAYLGAIDGNGNIVGGDPYTGVSGNKYVAMFNENYQRIKAARAARQPTTTGGGVSGIWGGLDVPVTQEIGVVTPGIDQGIYGYGAQMGMSGHTGLDIGTAHGTPLYSTFSGTVSIAGGSGFYRDETGQYDPATSGEVRVTLDNGHQIILGHTSQIKVQQGQRVTPGMLLALSGTANGAHLHLEYRIPDPSTPSGWRIVDPRQYLR